MIQALGLNEFVGAGLAPARLRNTVTLAGGREGRPYVWDPALMADLDFDEFVGAGLAPARLSNTVTLAGGREGRPYGASL